MQNKINCIYHYLQATIKYYILYKTQPIFLFLFLSALKKVEVLKMKTLVLLSSFFLGTLYRPDTFGPELMNLLSSQNLRREKHCALLQYIYLTVHVIERSNGDTR